MSVTTHTFSANVLIGRDIIADDVIAEGLHAVSDDHVIMDTRAYRRGSLVMTIQIDFLSDSADAVTTAKAVARALQHGWSVDALTLDGTPLPSLTTTKEI